MQDNIPSIAIVILNWNGAGYLQKFLPFLLSRTDSSTARIIVADNASTDNSLELLAKDFPKVQVIALDKNYGFAEGYNRALKQAGAAEYYVLLNSDVEVAEGWLEPLKDYMNKHPEVAACQPKIRSYDQRDAFEHAGASGGFIDRYGFPFCRGRIVSTVEKDAGQYDDIIPVFWATGACLFIRSECYWNAGGLDSKFFAHMEEIDLCWRLRSRGYQLVCIPQSVVYHVGGGTLGAESPYKTYLNFRNNLLMLYKNLPDNQRRKILFVRFFFDYAAAFQMLVSGKWNNFKSVLKARRDYKKMRSECKADRDNNLRLSCNTTIDEIYPRSIIIQYYLKGKKKYTQLGF